MTKRMLPIYICLVCCGIAATASAQATAHRYRLTDLQQLWHQTRNAAGMTLDFHTTDSTQNRGVAYFDLQHTGGDYHRVQDGGMRNNLHFFTERYQKIGRYLYGYGAFDFNMGRTKQRAWSDVLRSYNSNPFISGGNVFGKYDHQDITLDASLSTIQLGRFTYGANVRYEVGDLSRLRDPRSRINLLDYRFTPSVTYQIKGSRVQEVQGSRVQGSRVQGSRVQGSRVQGSRVQSSRVQGSRVQGSRVQGSRVQGSRVQGVQEFNVQSIGLALHYDRRKEKLPGLTTVQTDPNLQYYVMTGLENATGTIGAYQGYMREYVNHELGGELSYGAAVQNALFKFQSVNALTLDHGTEYVYGTYKYEPGRYYTYRYGLSTQNRLRHGGLLHSLDVAVSYEQAYADEYRQERISETDGQTGYTSIRWNTTLQYRKRYQLKHLELNMHYRLTFTDGDSQRGYVGGRYQLHDVSNKRLLPVSTFDYAASDILAEGGITLLGHRLLADAQAGYHIASKADLALADATTDYAVGVLLPDRDILNANYFQARLQLEYQQPVSIKGRQTQWFVRCYGQHIGAQHGLNRSTAGVSVGLYY